MMKNDDGDGWVMMLGDETLIFYYYLENKKRGSFFVCLRVFCVYYAYAERGS